MNVYEICQRHVVTVRRYEELRTAARMMRERNVGCLVVVEPAGGPGGERVVGLLTDRDIVTQAVASDSDLHRVLVEDVMTRHPVSAPAHAGIEETLQQMRAAGVRRVPLIDDRGRLAGIVALDDIFEHLGQHGIPSLPRQEWHRQDLHAAP